MLLFQAMLTGRKLVKFSFRMALGVVVSFLTLGAGIITPDAVIGLLTGMLCVTFLEISRQVEGMEELWLRSSGTPFEEALEEYAHLPACDAW